MLKENWRFIARIERLGDNIIIIAAFFLSYYGRASLQYWDRRFGLAIPFEAGGLLPLKDYFIVLIVALVSYAAALNFVGAYGSMRLRTSFQILWMSLLSSFLVFFSLAAVLFTLKVDLSRSFIGLFCLTCALALTVERFIVLRFLRYWRRKGRNFRNLIICGIGEQALHLAHEISLRPEIGIGIRGFADLRTRVDGVEAERSNFKKNLESVAGIRAVRILPSKDAVERAIGEYAIDEVVFTDVVDVMPVVADLIVTCSEQGVRTTIAADLMSVGMVKSGISYFGNMPLIHFQTPPGDGWGLILKRWLDFLVSGVLLVLLSPLFPIIALLVRITSEGPILFRQKRIGLNGRIFTLYKFRSMYQGAEGDLLKLREKNEMKGPAFKMKDDPRVTPVGRFLRRFSLDELPQLWNVFRGDMSLVGPRPPVPGEVSLYERKDRRRLSMRPGITCTWQVSGRNEISDFESWVKLDLDYIDNWSLSRDIFLLLRTIPAVFFGTGAR